MTLSRKSYWMKIERLLSEAEENIDNVFGNYTTGELDEIFHKIRETRKILRKVVGKSRDNYRFPYIYALALKLKTELVYYLTMLQLRKQGFHDSYEYADADLEERLIQDMLVEYNEIIQRYLGEMLDLYLMENHEES